MGFILIHNNIGRYRGNKAQSRKRRGQDTLFYDFFLLCTWLLCFLTLYTCYVYLFVTIMLLEKAINHNAMVKKRGGGSEIHLDTFLLGHHHYLYVL